MSPRSRHASWGSAGACERERARTPDALRTKPGSYRVPLTPLAAFGDIGFPLQVGEINMSTYDPKKSPFGWHVIKRVE